MAKGGGSGATAGSFSKNEHGHHGHDIIRGGQINLHKSHISAASLLQYLTTAMQNRHPNSKSGSNNDNSPQVGGFIIGIQEPPVAFGKVFGLDKQHQVFQKVGKDKERPRAALYISKGIQAWELPEHTNLDMVSCMVTVGGKLQRLIVTSLYLDIRKPAWPATLDGLVSYCRRLRLQLLILADTNAHSVLWGQETNPRGEMLEQGIAAADLQIFNAGYKPTFFNRRAATTIDVSFGTAGVGKLIANWSTTDEIAGTDHRLISFDITISIKSVRFVREWNKGDWKLFQAITDKHARHQPELWNEESLEVEAANFQEIVTAALDESHPLRIITKPKVTMPHWWGEEASTLHQKVRKCVRKFRKQRNDVNFEELKEARRKYSKYIRKARRESWQQFTMNCDNPKKLAKLQRAVQQQDNRKLGTLKREDNTLCITSQEILGRLVDEHFPGNVEVEEPVPPFAGNSCNINDEEVGFLSIGMVVEAIKSFGSHKAPGADGIVPLVLKHLGGAMLKKLTAIFKASVLLKYIPTCWRKSRVVYIPKPGKEDYTNVRSFRPISLTSFVLKTLEKVWGWQLRLTALRENPLGANQHAFRPGYSTESALSNMVEYVEASFIKKGFALGVFLDIQGAFDNVPTQSILQGMRNQGLPSTFVDWYHALLDNRMMISSLGDETLERKLPRGSPQGGSSPRWPGTTPLRASSPYATQAPRRWWASQTMRGSLSRGTSRAH